MAEDPPQPPDGGSTEAKKGKNQRRYQQRAGITKTAFEGRSDDLKGYIYDCTNAAKAADMYTKTTREIAEYTHR
jgi:hypothetical protein